MDRYKDRSLFRQSTTGGRLRFKKGFSQAISAAHYLSCRLHLRRQKRIQTLKPFKGKHSFLYRPLLQRCSDSKALRTETELSKVSSGPDMDSRINQIYPRSLCQKRNSPGGPGIYLNNI